MSIRSLESVGGSDQMDKKVFTDDILRRTFTKNTFVPPGLLGPLSVGPVQTK